MAMTSDLVSSTIVGRAQAPDGLRRMMMVSTAGHAAAIVAIVVAPWLLSSGSKPPEVMMEISLGPPPGPVTGGMSGMSRSAVQKAEPKPELPKPQPARPPAAKTPEMVENISKTTLKPPVKQASTSTRQAPPTTGEAVRTGESRVENNSMSNEGGLSTGGAGTGGQMNNVNFCDPEYLGQMISLIYRNWDQKGTAAAARPVIRFVIQRDGTLTDITLRQPSGYQGPDFNAQRAVMLTRAIPPLPTCYPNPTYAMNLTFEYIR
ncbi:MAG: TonB C-terminal domain-containing protein [Vicinamibacteraceae bacterium]